MFIVTEYAALNNLDFGLVVQEKMSFYSMSYL